MPRSAEALKRRAEKRNISEKEMRKIDAQPTKKAKPDEQFPASRKPKVDSRPTQKWTCKVCTNVNLAHMCPKKCNNCQRPRVEVDEEFEFGSDSKNPPDTKPEASTHWKCLKCSNKNMTKYFPITCNRCQRDRSTETEEGPGATSAPESAAKAVQKTQKLSANCLSKGIDAVATSKDSLGVHQSGKKRSRSIVETESADSRGDTRAKSVSAIDVQASASSKYWNCTACKNRNIATVHTLICNRCCRHRKEVEAKKDASSEGDARFSPIAMMEPTSAVAVSNNDKGVSKSTEHWFCSACKNRNICAVHTLTCNRCQRHRSDVEDSALLSLKTTTATTTTTTATTTVTATVTPTAKKIHATPPVWTCVKCKNRNLISLSLTACNRCQRSREEVDSAVDNIKDKIDTAIEKNKASNNWDASVADKALIERNMKLREDYLNPDICKTLSEEDKQRAEVLIERSKRKLEKKEKRNAWKKKIKKR